MCCNNAQWKREIVPDHKFDFIDVQEFRVTNFTTRAQYAWVWILGILSFLVYIADCYTAIALLASNHWSGSILESQGAQNSATLQVPFTIGKWIFTGCIILSFLLLAWEVRKARAIIKSRDISYAFTNVLSQDYYSMRSYNHFCFFCQIDNSKKKKDELAFFIFFTFKGWKRLLLADAPRQVVNALTLYAFGQSQNWTTDVYQYFKGNIFTAGIILTMLFTLFIWTISAVLLLVAAILYVPLLCYIQGNLKEYCCHKADKRIADLMKRKNRKRLAKEAEIAKKEARGDFSHLKDKKGKFTAAPLPQPTLPQIGLADEDLYAPAYPDSDSGSLRGASMKKSASGEGYAYPPTNGGYQPSWENQYDRSRPAYPNHPSQMDSLHYADSTHSADLAYDVGYGESSLALNDLGHPSRPGMSHAPSYQSRIGDYGYADGRGEQQQQHYDSYGMEKEMYVNGRGGQQYGHEQYDEKEYAYGEEYQRYPSPHDGRSASRQQDRSTHRPTGSQSSYVSQQQSTHPSSSRPDASNRHASQISEASSIAYSNGNGSGHGTSRDGRQGGNDGRSRNR